MASDRLRARIDAAIRQNLLFGLQDAELYDEPGRKRINEWADWISKTIAELLQPELDRLQALNDDAWGSVWLHGKWSWLTKCMTTEEREHAADCVARWSARLAAIDGHLERGEPEGLRWWREPSVSLRAELPLTAYMGVEEPRARESTETVRGGRRLARGPYPKPAHGATVASDRCPSCGGDNTEPWALCPQCQPTTKE